MAGAKLDLDVVQDEDFHLELTVKDKATGNPIDITGWSWEGQVHEKDGGSSVFAFTFTDIDTVNGRVDMDVARATTNTAVDGVHEYDVFSIDTTPRRRQRMRGKFTVLKKVTGSS